MTEFFHKGIFTHCCLIKRDIFGGYCLSRVYTSLAISKPSVNDAGMSGIITSADFTAWINDVVIDHVCKFESY